MTTSASCWLKQKRVCETYCVWNIVWAYTNPPPVEVLVTQWPLHSNSTTSDTFSCPGQKGQINIPPCSIIKTIKYSLFSKGFSSYLLNIYWGYPLTQSLHRPHYLKSKTPALNKKNENPWLNGRQWYSAFSNQRPLKALCTIAKHSPIHTHIPTYVHTHIHTPTAMPTLQGKASSLGEVRVRYFAHGNLETQLGTAGDLTNNLVASQAPLPPEPLSFHSTLRPCMYPIFIYTYILLYIYINILSRCVSMWAVHSVWCIVGWR